jgi:hypothetical protein
MDVKSHSLKLAIAGAVGAALLFAGSWTGALASQPTFGLPPKAGSYKLSGTGSRLTVVRKGSHYLVRDFRLRVSNDCGLIGGQLAVISRPLKLSKVVRHRIGEDEVSYELARLKGFRASGHGNVSVSVEGQRFAGNLNVGFTRGISGFKPVQGDLDLGPLEGEDCDTIFSGHRR